MKTTTVDNARDMCSTPNVQELCAACGARCCKPVLTGKDRYLLYLRTGDVAQMEKDGLGVFVLEKSTHPLFDEKYSIVPHIFGYCPFLDLQTSACTIYDQRPRVCQIYPYSLSKEYITTLHQLSPLSTYFPTVEYEEAKEYGLTQCLLHQHTIPEEYQKQVNTLIETDLQMMTDILTLHKKDEEALLRLRYLQFPFFLPEQLFLQEDPEIREQFLQYKPQIPHILDNENEEGSFIISGPPTVSQQLFPPLLKLMKRYRAVMRQTPLYLYITLVGPVPPSHRDQFPGLRFIPLLQIRGIMGKNHQHLTVLEILKKIRLCSGANQPNGRFLMGILLYDDLFRDFSYWQAYWEELKQVLPMRKRDVNRLKPPKPNPPFRPRRRK